MWTSTVELDPKRVLLTHALGRFWRGAYFASFAPLQVRNVPRASLPSSAWVRVRNRLAGISGRDLQLVHANEDIRVSTAALPAHGPLFPGSEVVGEVIEIGDDVRHLRVGDRVALQSGANCLAAGVQPLCRSCANGNYTLCEYGDLPGLSSIGGGWSEEMLLHEQQLFRVSPALTDEQAVLLEPGSIALHALLRHLPQPGDRVLIVGAGTIGLLMLQLLHLFAPQSEISVLARYPFQVEQATRFGASHIIYPQDTYVGVQRATSTRLYHGVFGNRALLGGYDVTFDTIGSRSSLHHALRWMRAKGSLVLLGQRPRMMHIDLTPIWHREINLIGVAGHGNERWPLGAEEQRSTFSIIAELIERGQLRPEQMITHHFALNDYRFALTAAFNKAQSRAIKVLFDYSLLPPSVVPNVRASARQQRTVTSEQAQRLPLPTPTTSAPGATMRPRRRTPEDDEWSPYPDTTTQPSPSNTRRNYPDYQHPVSPPEFGEQKISDETSPAMPVVHKSPPGPVSRPPNPVPSPAIGGESPATPTERITVESHTTQQPERQPSPQVAQPPPATTVPPNELIVQQDFAPLPAVAQQHPPITTAPKEHSSEQTAAATRAEELSQDVSEPTPWTWLSYLEPATTTPKEASSPEAASALSGVEDTPPLAPPPNASEEARKKNRQDKNA